MSVAKITRAYIDKLDSAKLFTYADILSTNKATVAIELSRLYIYSLIL